MNFIHITNLLFDFIGTAAFGVSGAIIAIKSKMDLGGVIFLSFVTGCGGGTIRDLILNAPVFWTQTPSIILLSIIPGLFFFFIYSSKHVRSRLFNLTLLIFDTAGLGAFTIAGVSKALLFNQDWLVSIMMGTVTAVGGGIIRDLLSNRIPAVFKPIFYLTPTVVGGAWYVLAYNYFNSLVAMVGGTLLVISLRFLGEGFHWTLPTK